MKISSRTIFLLLFFFCGLLSFSYSAELFQRGLFVSLIQKPSVFSSRETVHQLIDDAKKIGVQTLFVQVYYGNRSVFVTKQADMTIFNVYSKNIGNDPLAYIIKEAHASGLQVHAWLNLLSLAGNDKAPMLKQYGASILTRNVRSKKSLEDHKIDGQYFLEPGDPRVRQTLGLLVADLLRAYPELDGLQFDYIRYPDVKPLYGYTPVNVERYLKAKGKDAVRDDDPDWRNWKRGQVTEVLEFLVKRARQIRPSILISTTGCMPYARAMEEAFQDWPGWLNSGLVDFVTVMNYSMDPEVFKRWSLAVKAKVKDPSKMNVAVGAYRMIDDPALFETQWKICEALGAGACVVFHYGDLLTSPLLMDVLKKNEVKK